MIDVQNTKLDGVKIIKVRRYCDNRGFFQENFNEREYRKHNISVDFVQDNFSFSKYGVLRGLHFQKSKPQGKLVSCVSGKFLM